MAEAVLKENEQLKERLAALEMEMQTLRFFTGKPDIDDMARRLEENGNIESPDVGTRVRVVHQGSKYNPKDFEKAGSFESFKGEYEDAVKNDTLGIILQKAKHFKKDTLEVFLIKFDNNKAAIMARKGFDVPLFLGCGVQVVNQGCKYAAKDFKDKAKEGYGGLTIVDDVKQNQRGVLTRILPHYKAKVMCFVVALNDTQVVIMNGKGIAPAEVRGLKERMQKRKEEREAAEAKAKEDTPAEGATEAAPEES